MQFIATYIAGEGWIFIGLAIALGIGALRHKRPRINRRKGNSVTRLNRTGMMPYIENRKEN